ncbi:MAG: 3'(2'),5'-bisphosphate nucleotidase CysQ [Hyphomonadaceae bacterium]|nr:3'(2'),5'-bisphosphate nucleotidase CysQ [Hyphomonadaceae bacterium]
MADKPKLEDLIALTLAAGREIMDVRRDGFEAMKKGDGSFVTIADQRAEAVIEAGLKKLAPNVPMVGEEASAEGRIPETGARFWLVDPLDGTRDFVAGKDEFTVNIALVENNTPTMGVVFAPASGELFAGEPGRALKARYDEHCNVVEPLKAISASTSRPPEGWRVVASRHSGGNQETADFLDALGETVLKNASSSIKLCRLCEGAADLYPRFGDVNEWDIAAGHAVLRAAGGDLMLLDGKPRAYGGVNGVFLVHSFVAYANGEAEAAARKALKV